MDETIVGIDFQGVYESPATDIELASERPCNHSSEFGANEDLDGCEQLEASYDGVIEHWRPTEPQFCKDIAAYYQQGKRTIQKWFVDLREIAPWLPESELRLSDDRYTPLAVELLGDRYFAKTKKKWAAVLSEKFADQIAEKAEAEAETSIPTHVVPPEVSQADPGARPGGLSLHIGSNAALPSVPQVMTPSNDRAYLTQAQRRLQAFESLQQQVIEQMREQHDQAQTLNAQFQEATSLSDELLLREFQLKGIQLGYTALQLKQEAFKATVQAVETGTLPAPGKPQPETPPSSST